MKNAQQVKKQTSKQAQQVKKKVKQTKKQIQQARKEAQQVKKQAEMYEKAILKQLGVFMYNKRKARGVTIKDLNIMTGVGTAVISDLENQNSMPRVETLIRICEVLEISTSEMFDNMKVGTVKLGNNTVCVVDSPRNKYDELSSFVAGLDYSKEDVADIVSYVKYLDFKKQAQ